MDELIKKSQELVKDNIKEGMNETLIEVIADAVLALLLIKPSITLEKIPSILRNLDIIADERKVIEMAHADLGNYMEDYFLKHSDAAVIRELNVDDSDNFLEIKHLLISLRNDNDWTNIIFKLIHEFMHLLRFSWSNYDKEANILKIKNGIEIDTYFIDKQELTRKNQYLEEGIAQFYTNMATKELANFLENKNVSNIKTLNCFKKEFPKLEFNLYLVQTSLIEKLTYDMNFFELLEETFKEEECNSKMEKYFNKIMNYEDAFSSLTRLVDDIYLALVNGSNQLAIKYGILQLNYIVGEYFKNLKNQSK